LLVTAEYDANVTLSARNLISVETLEASQLDPVSLVGSEHIVFTESALRRVEEALQ
jgi:large subunit ribosomal protein L4